MTSMDLMRLPIHNVPVPICHRLVVRQNLDLTRRPLGRLRAIATGNNPPTNQEGQWIVGLLEALA